LLLCLATWNSADLQALADTFRPFYNPGAKVTVVHGKEQRNLWTSAATTQIDMPQPSYCNYELTNQNFEPVSSRRARTDTIKSPAAFVGSAIQLVTEALLSKPTIYDFSFSASNVQRRVSKSTATAAAVAQHRDRGVDAPHRDYGHGGRHSASADNEHTGQHYSRADIQHQYSYQGPLQPPVYPSHPVVTGAQMISLTSSYLNMRTNGNDTDATGVLTEDDFNSFGECKRYNGCMWLAASA
jgi:hypothetical protein